MTKTVIEDKTMLFLVLFAAFFVGSAITAVFSDYEVKATKDDNNGSNGCEKANPNAKACGNVPNTDPIEYTCLYCIEQYVETSNACTDSQCQSDAIRDFHACNDVVERTSEDMCEPVPPGGF